MLLLFPLLDIIYCDGVAGWHWPARSRPVPGQGSGVSKAHGLPAPEPRVEGAIRGGRSGQHDPEPGAHRHQQPPGACAATLALWIIGMRPAPESRPARGIMVNRGEVEVQLCGSRRFRCRIRPNAREQLASVCIARRVKRSILKLSRRRPARKGSRIAAELSWLGLPGSAHWRHEPAADSRVEPTLFSQPYSRSKPKRQPPSPCPSPRGRANVLPRRGPAPDARLLDADLEALNA